MPPSGLLPPPPMGFPSLKMPEEKKKPIIESKVKLKNCNYKDLKFDKIKDTFWENVDDMKVDINRNELEEMFAKTMAKKSDDKMVQSLIHLDAKPKNEVVKLIGADRSRNYEIILTTLKYMPGLVSEALTQCSGKYATNKTLESLNKLCPT